MTAFITRLTELAGTAIADTLAAEFAGRTVYIARQQKPWSAVGIPQGWECNASCHQCSAGFEPSPQVPMQHPAPQLNATADSLQPTRAAIGQGLRHRFYTVLARALCMRSKAQEPLHRVCDPA